jgi:deoxyguanosine kinase
MIIAVEGCIGAGKTTVAKRLADFRVANLLLEDFEKNPFLQEFYKNPEKTSVETEFCFLLVHYHQLKMRDGIDGELIADFCLAKDLLYSDMNLKGSPYQRIFEQLYATLTAEIMQPDVVICLSASNSTIRRRIVERNRAFEQDFDFSYYERLNAAYDRFFDELVCRKIALDMDEWDCVQEPALIDQLSALIDIEMGTVG